MSATDATFPILPILGVSVIYVKRFQGVLADNLHHTQSPPRVDHYNNTTLGVHTYIYDLTVPWNNDSICQSTPCTAAAFPKFMPLSRHYVDEKHTKKARQVEQNINVTF